MDRVGAEGRVLGREQERKRVIMKISEGAPPAPPQNNVVVEKTGLSGVQNKRRSFPDQANAPVPQTQKDKRDFTKSTLYSGGRGGRVVLKHPQKVFVGTGRRRLFCKHRSKFFGDD